MRVKPLSDPQCSICHMGDEENLHAQPRDGKRALEGSSAPGLQSHAFFFALQILAALSRVLFEIFAQFENLFLARYDGALMAVAAQAERYFAEDPVTCLMKLRQFGELLAQQLAGRLPGAVLDAFGHVIGETYEGPRPGVAQGQGLHIGSSQSARSGS